MKRSVFVCLSVSVLIIPLLAQDYRFTTFPSPAVPDAINSSGLVAGHGNPNTGQDEAFVWTRTGGFQFLGDLGGGTSVPTAVNDSGAVVGYSKLASGTSHAFRWTPSGGMQDLGSPLGGDSRATAINTAGEVAGVSSTPDGSISHAFFWSPAAGVIDISTGSYDWHNLPLALNNNGEIAGNDWSLGSRAFRWTQAAGIQILPDFTGTDYAQTFAVNDSGEIAGWGWYKYPNGYYEDRAALWSSEGSVQDLGALAGDLDSCAQLINAAGHVAGYSRPYNYSYRFRTFFWSPETGIVDIGHLFQQQYLSLPGGLNNRDQIVGYNAGATYLWSPTIGIHRIVGIKLNPTPNNGVLRTLNDAGQFVGQTASGIAVATPVMQVGVSSSQNPSQAGERVTLTAKVSAIVGLPPDGEQVSFLDGQVVLGTSTLSNGTATFTTSPLKARTHYIRAMYAGDSNYYPSRSVPLQQVVNP